MRKLREEKERENKALREQRKRMEEEEAAKLREIQKKKMEEVSSTMWKSLKFDPEFKVDEDRQK